MCSSLYKIAAIYKMAFVSWTIQHFRVYTIYMHPSINTSLMMSTFLIYFYILNLNFWWSISEPTSKTNFSLYKAFDEAFAEFQRLK